VEIYASTSAGDGPESVALILGVPNSDVRIVPLACGGGFGAKLDLSVHRISRLLRG
jgi:aldehyde oxidoreductase